MSSATNKLEKFTSIINFVRFREGKHVFRDGFYRVPEGEIKLLEFAQWTPTWDTRCRQEFEDIPSFKPLDRGYFSDLHLIHYLSV